MNYKLLGTSGVKVSEICLGTMGFGNEWGWGISEEEARLQFDHFAENGGNFVDTANKYTNGTSEKILGNILKGRRDDFVVATKYTLNMQDGQPNKWGNSRKNMFNSIDESLKRLQTDYIDIYWVHFWDFTTSIEEVLRGLDDLVRMGKILYIGISDAPAWIMSSANTMANLRGWSPFVAMQIEYSLAQRTVEHELIPYSNYQNMSVLAWGALAGGMLTGKYKNDSINNSARAATNQRRVTPRNETIVDELIKISNEIGKTPTEIAIRWTMQKSQNVIPLVGARNIEQLDGIIAATQFELSEEIMTKLNEISKIDYIFPYSMWQYANESILTGGTGDKIKGWKKYFSVL